MIDIETLRKNPQAAAAALARRPGAILDLPLFAQLDQERRTALAAFDSIQRERGAIADAIGRAKRSGVDASSLLPRGEAAKQGAEQARARLDLAEGAFRDFAMRIPNLPAAGVPDGKGEADNQLLRQVGTPPALGFAPKTHDELGALHQGLDFEAAARLSGARFVVASGPLARLHRALIQFMLDTHVDEGGYTEVQTPYLVKASALEGTGQLPKFEDDLFKLERDGLYLIPTAEVPVTNLLAHMDLREDQLPLAFVCHTPCFRREAGSAGRDVKGLIRQHQFEKVELVRACAPESSADQMDILLAHAESILAKLGLPYRAMALCAGDLGFSAERTVDLEVWLPGQDAWREISSVSAFGSFQARRMGAKFKAADGKRRFLSTLNGSGLAAGRALVAVMENFQTPSGAIVVPPPLRPYMGGLALIEPPAPCAPKPRRAPGS